MTDLLKFGKDDDSQWQKRLRLLESAVRYAGDAIVITDSQLDLPGPRIVFVNPAFTRMTGYQAEEVMGKTPRILQGRKTDRAQRRELRRVLEMGEIFSGQTVNYRKDGSEFFVEWTINPIRDETGKITHFVSVQRDISDRRMLEEKLRQAQRMEAMGRLAGGVAHDFNNLLTVIEGYADLALGKACGAGIEFGELKEIRRAAERAAELTRQLLTFSRSQVVSPQRVRINEVIAETEKMLRRVIGEDVELVVRTEERLDDVLADAGQIVQVLMNLVINARDAMPKGGRILIETGSRRVDRMPLSTWGEAKPGEWVALEVRDEGVGMDESTMAHLFEPFFTTKGKNKGTGLGLATVYGIVRQSRGFLQVESRPGKGSTFRVFLPPAARVPATS